MRKADVIIPTFKPGDKLEKLLRRLLEQSVPVGRVIIMNTEEKYWDAERFESLFEGEDTKLTVCHIRQSEFDHGRTRHEGILKSDADVCICMTHDCVPYDRNLVKELLEALDGGGVRLGDQQAAAVLHLVALHALAGFPNVGVAQAAGENNFV